ncbi:hypothetical protein, partial [Lichenifustis flavocetrariae]
ARRQLVGSAAVDERLIGPHSQTRQHTKFQKRRKIVTGSSHHPFATCQLFDFTGLLGTPQESQKGPARDQDIEKAPGTRGLGAKRSSQPEAGEARQIE